MYKITEIAYVEWESHFRKCNKTNLLQSWNYGSVKEQTEKWKAIRFLVSDENNIAIALTQVLTRTLPILGGFARINRGPLIIDDINANSNIIYSNVIAALLTLSKKKRWWIVQIAPEMIESLKSNTLLTNLGLKKLSNIPAGSGLISLLKSEDELMMNLKGKWRNCLRKGLRSDIDIKSSNGNCADIKHLLSFYHDIQLKNNFEGISDALIISLSSQEGQNWRFTLFTAIQEMNSVDEKCIGILVSIRHGDTSTYLIGASNHQGRLNQVNYVLLWHAILHAKNTGCSWFDIGGLNATTPKSIAHFKLGVNSELYNLIGEWRATMLPFKNIQT